MSKKLISIIDELQNYIPSIDKFDIVESKASNVITSFINIIELIEDHFDEEEADALIKRLFLSVKTKDADKFIRKIRSMKKIVSMDDTKEK